MSVKKVVLAISVILSIFVLYFGFGTNPDVVLFSLGGFQFGPNVSEYAILKLISVSMWGLFILLPSNFKGDDD